MNLRFYKLQSAGNDYILIDHCLTAVEKKPDYPELARAILKRRSGVGGSGLILLEPIKDGPALVRAYGPDGVESAVSNDALICAARYLFDSGKVVAEGFSLATASGTRKIEVLTAKDFRIGLGKPTDPLSGRELSETQGPDNRAVLEAQGRRLSVSTVELKECYAILFSSDSRRSDLESLQRGLVSLSRKGKNYRALAVRPLSRDTLVLMAERKQVLDGIEATGAALTAAVIAGVCDREATFIQGSGIRYADWDESSGEVSVTASAQYVFEGQWYQAESEATKGAQTGEEGSEAGE